MVGHSDWRVQNLRYDAVRLSAINDWDSLVVRPEAALAGAVAAIFTVDWTQLGRCRIPTLDEMAAFLADYERARGRPFGPEERELARAALVHLVAYNARCEWSGVLTDMGRREPAAAPATLPPDGFLARLATLAA